MLRAATAHSSWLMVDAWEAHQAAPSPSYVVAEHLSATVPTARVVFVCGGDLAHAMADPSRWPRRNVRLLSSAATIAILQRTGAPDPPSSLEDTNGTARPTLIIDAPALPGSSSDVRCVTTTPAPPAHLQALIAHARRATDSAQRGHRASSDHNTSCTQGCRSVYPNAPSFYRIVPSEANDIYKNQPNLSATFHAPSARGTCKRTSALRLRVPFGSKRAESSSADLDTSRLSDRPSSE